MTEQQTAERTFRAMGTEVHVMIVGGAAATRGDLAALVERAIERIDELERRWSRFLPDSEVSELTRRAGSPVAVCADTRLLVELARDAWLISGGSFDPTVLGDVLRAGYDRTFDEIERSRATYSSLLIGCADILVEGDTVTLPAGTGFDPGGIGKGLAADLVSRELIEAGAAGACVNLGGDVRVRGDGPAGSGTGWTISIDHPWSHEPLALVGVRDGAVASSTTLRRRWLRDGVVRHHLIDPGTGQPTDSDLELVSVVARNAWVAEILAKAVLLRGSAHPFDLIDGSMAEALAVDDLGGVHTSAGFHRFAGTTTTGFVARCDGAAALDQLINH